MLSLFASHVFLQLLCFRVNRATSIFREPKKGDGPCCLAFWVLDGNLPTCPLKPGCKQPADRLQTGDISTFRCGCWLQPINSSWPYGPAYIVEGLLPPGLPIALQNPVGHEVFKSLPL